jgi:sugar phosphate isomerase/epimerase
MITISAFADEIAHDLKTQIDVCESVDVKHIDVRNIDNTNVSKLSLDQAREAKKQLDDRGFAVPCLGSPIGKIRMDEDFDEHMRLLAHCFELAEAFGTNQIRMFSFYPSEGKNIEDERPGVMDRMAAMVEAAEKAGMILLHENEAKIYGATPAGVKDLFATIKSPSFKGIFDPANFVVEGVAPYDDAWTQGLAELTDYFHIKDKKPDEKACCPAGEGAGQFREIFADAKVRGYSGYATLEPHLRVAGQFKGDTGPELFATAARAFQKILDGLGIDWK